MYTYGISEYIWGIVYLIFMTVMSLSNGIIVLHMCKKDMNKPLGICIGIGITPFIISLWMVAISFIPAFPYKQYFALFFPLLFSVFMLIRLHSELLDVKKILINYCKENLLLILITLFISIIFVAGLLLGISGYLVYTDAGFYAGEALNFVNSLSFKDIASYVDVQGLNGSVHNFSWPAYLSYGMLFTSYGQFGLNHDLSMFLGIRIMPVYILIVMFGLLKDLCNNSKVAFAGILLSFWIPYIDFSRSYSRDFYRIIPIFLIISLMNVELRDKKPKTPFYYVLLFLVAAFIPSGHPINIFTIFAIAAAWAVCHIINKREIKHLIIYGGIIALGIIFGAYNIIYAFIKTGKLSGNSSLYMENIFAGTELYDMYLSSISVTTSRGMGIPETWRRIFTLDVHHIISIGMICIIFIAIFCIIKKHLIKDLYIHLIFLFSVIIIFAGHFIGWGGFQYDEWLSRNSRYSYQFFYLAVLCITCTLSYVLEKYPSKISKVALYSAIAILSITSIRYVWLSGAELKSYVSFNEKVIYDEAIAPINEVIDLAGDEKTIITQTNYVYDTGVRAELLSSYYGVPLFKSKTVQEVENFFGQNNVRFICFESVYLNWIYNRSRFYQLIQESEQIKLYKKTDYVEIYEILK